MMWIFNGDLVDRGDHACEIVLLIFALKLKHPKHVFVNRGNHEEPHINIYSGFEEECVSKYDHRVFQTFHQAFVWLPYACLVNEKTLVLTSRGATSRYRHLMLDLLTLVPNAKKDAKLDTKNERNVVVEAADLRGCSSAMFFECRKKQDCYMWLAKTPSGPSIKFHVENVHTMAELKMTGNHLKFSRPSLHFAPAFDETAHRRLIKEALIQTFATPYRHFKSKPFYDHQMCFYWEDNRVWFRNYQVVHPAGKEVKTQGLTLSETGPRLCLHPIKIFAGAFGGAVLFEDETFVSPNAQRAESKKRDVTKYQQKVQKKQARKAHKHMNQLRGGELDDLFRDGDD